MYVREQSDFCSLASICSWTIKRVCILGGEGFYSFSFFLFFPCPIYYNVLYLTYVSSVSCELAVASPGSGLH